MNLKSLQKKLLFITPILIGVGIFLTIIGVVLGGHPGFSIGSSGIMTHKNKADYAMEKTEFDPVDSMELEVPFGDIIFEESDGFYIEYNLTGSGSVAKPVYYIANGTLVFKTESAASFSIMDFSWPTDNNGYLKIYMPSNTKLNQLTINNSSGNISLSNAEITNIDVTADFGNVTFKGITCEEMNLDLSSGKANLSEIWAVDLYINNDFGNITINQMNVNSNLPGTSTVTLQMSSGDLSMTDVYADSLTASNDFGACNGQNMDIGELTVTLSSGNCTLNQLKTNHASITNDFGSTKLQLMEKEDAYDYDLNTDFGSIRINGSKYSSGTNIERGRDNKIDITNSSGDIEITTLK